LNLKIIFISVRPRYL